MAYICKFIDNHNNVYILYLILNLPPASHSKKPDLNLYTNLKYVIICI
jgi:hypothetical protein